MERIIRNFNLRGCKVFNILHIITSMCYNKNFIVLKTKNV
jgi:hypothetical protein